MRVALGCGQSVRAYYRGCQHCKKKKAFYGRCNSNISEPPGLKTARDPHLLPPSPPSPPHSFLHHHPLLLALRVSPGEVGSFRFNCFAPFVSHVRPTAHPCRRFTLPVLPLPTLCILSRLVARIPHRTGSAQHSAACSDSIHQ